MQKAETLKLPDLNGLMLRNGGAFRTITEIAIIFRRTELNETRTTKTAWIKSFGRESVAMQDLHAYADRGSLHRNECVFVNFFGIIRNRELEVLAIGMEFSIDIGPATVENLSILVMKHLRSCTKPHEYE